MSRKWGNSTEQEKTRIFLLTQSEVGQRLLFFFTISLLGITASKTHLNTSILQLPLHLRPVISGTQFVACVL